MPEGKHLYEFGPFRLDPAERSLLRDGKAVPLTPKTFDLLLLLVQNRGHLLKKDDLIERVWPNTFVEEANLAQNVSALRKALDDKNGGAQYIETVPKGGYRFTAAVEDHTPSTAVESPAVEPASSRPASRVAPRYVLAFLVVAAVAVTLILVFQRGLLRWRWSGAASVPRIQSLAVLPLHNLSNDTEQEYFSDGMTDELITEISKFGPLRVISHSSVERYKEGKQPLAEIARELGVDAVVEGTVMRSENRIRITARLIDARSDRNLWAQSYERDLRDVLTLQNEVARQVATEVGINLTAGERARLASIREINPDAHEAYLRGIFYWKQLSCEGFRKGLQYFEQSADKDPHFALAHLGIAQSYSIMADWGCAHQPEYEALRQSKAAVLKAIELDPNLGAAHAWLGKHAFFYEWDWPKAEAEFKQAIELDPNDSGAHGAYAHFLVAMGRREQGLAEMRRALDHDPTSLPTNYSATYLLYLARQYDEAIDQGKKTIELYPNMTAAYIWLAPPYEMKGMEDESIAMRLKSETAWGATPKDLALIRSAYQKFGLRGYWRHELEVERARGTDNAPYKACWMGEVYAHLGEKKRALEYLSRAFQSHCYGLQLLNVDPVYDSLREEPAFKELISRLRL
jgi:TolB-like protein/DNA-binding winged helix-turn-helix (wHTH) protein/Tfp pilus assembly protein PilF